jgi:hypothetical protein
MKLSNATRILCNVIALYRPTYTLCRLISRFKGINNKIYFPLQCNNYKQWLYDKINMKANDRSNVAVNASGSSYPLCFYISITSTYDLKMAKHGRNMSSTQ